MGRQVLGIYPVMRRYSALVAFYIVWFALSTVLAQPPAEGSWGYEFPVPVGNDAPFRPNQIGMTGASSPIRAAVAPKVAIGTSDIRVTAMVERHPDNRYLLLTIDGPQFMRQDIELNTDARHQDARTHERWFKRVPPGRYTVVAEIRRVNGRSFRSTSAFCLVGIDESCQ